MEGELVQYFVKIDRSLVFDSKILLLCQPKMSGLFGSMFVHRRHLLSLK